MAQKIYFNVHVSNYFNVDFNNKGKEATLNSKDILNCSIVSWDIDIKKVLEKMGDKKIKLTGAGSGWWEFSTENESDVVESKMSYNNFMKGGGIFLFI
jgi:hypothetical protein